MIALPDYPPLIPLHPNSSLIPAKLAQRLELGPIAVFPPITPKMQKQARVFTISYLAALVVAAVISVLM